MNNNIPPSDLTFGLQGVSPSPEDKITGFPNTGIPPHAPKSPVVSRGLGNENTEAVNMPNLLEGLVHETFSGCPHSLLDRGVLVGLFNTLFNTP